MLKKLMTSFFAFLEVFGSCSSDSVETGIGGSQWAQGRESTEGVPKVPNPIPGSFSSCLLQYVAWCYLGGKEHPCGSRVMPFSVSKFFEHSPNSHNTLRH